MEFTIPLLTNRCLLHKLDTCTFFTVSFFSHLTKGNFVCWTSQSSGGPSSSPGKSIICSELKVNTITAAADGSYQLSVKLIQSKLHHYVGNLRFCHLNLIHKHRLPFLMLLNLLLKVLPFRHRLLEGMFTLDLHELTVDAVQLVKYMVKGSIVSFHLVLQG